MKIVLVILVLLLIVVSIFIFLKNKPAKIVSVDQMLDEEVSKYRRNMQPDIAIGIYKNGKIIFRNYGLSVKNGLLVYRSYDNGITENSIFQIGSITKLFTAASFQILVDEQKINYKTKISELLIAVDSRIKNIPVLELVTHTSGMPSVPKPLMEYVERKAGKENLLINPYSHLDEQLVLNYLNNPIDLNDKKTFVYSNYGMGLLGYLLAKINHTSYEELVNEKLLIPLDMTNTFIKKQDIDQLVQGHTANGEVNPPWTFGALEAAGAFNSNTKDMMKFIIANLDENSPLFSTLVKTHSPQKNGETGIGWMQPNAIDKLAGNSGMVWHNGMVGGFASYIAINKEQQTGLIFLSNHAIDTTVVGTMIMRRLRNTELTE